MSDSERVGSIGPGPPLRQVKGVDGLKRRLGQLRYLICHPFAHRRYILEIEGYIPRGIVTDGIFQRYKYLGDYLARSFSRSTRRALILSHYRFVAPRLPAAAATAMARDGIALWRHRFDGRCSLIRLSVGRFAPMEGEWQLQFMLDDRVLCTISFLFSSLPPFAGEGETVCLIGGVQGGYDCRAAVRAAAKAHDEIAPTTMLIVTVKAVAQALGIGSVFGVSSRQQVVAPYATDAMKADYDSIWRSEGASSCIDGFYALSRDIVERDLSDIPRSHRRRTRRKRERKAELLAILAASATVAFAAPRPLAAPEGDGHSASR